MPITSLEGSSSTVSDGNPAQDTGTGYKSTMTGTKNTFSWSRRPQWDVNVTDSIRSCADQFLDCPPTLLQLQRMLIRDLHNRSTIPLLFPLIYSTLCLRNVSSGSVYIHRWFFTITNCQHFIARYNNKIKL